MNEKIINQFTYLYNNKYIKHEIVNISAHSICMYITEVNIHFRCSRAVDILSVSRRNECRVTRHVTADNPTDIFSIPDDAPPMIKTVFNH